MEICSAFLPRLTSKFVILRNLRPEKAVPRTTRDTVATAWHNFGKYHSALCLKYGKSDFLFVFNDAKFMGPGIPAVDGLQWCGQVFTSQRAVAKKKMSNGKLRLGIYKGSKQTGIQCYHAPGLPCKRLLETRWAPVCLSDQVDLSSRPQRDSKRAKI